MGWKGCKRMTARQLVWFHISGFTISERLKKVTTTAHTIIKSGVRRILDFVKRVVTQLTLYVMKKIWAKMWSCGMVHWNAKGLNQQIK